MVVENGYTTRDQLKNWLGIDLADTEVDDLLDAAINAVSRWIDTTTKRHFYLLTEPRLFEAETGGLVWFGKYSDLSDDPSEVATDPDGDGSFSTVWDPADYELRPLRRNAGPEQRPYRLIRAVGSLRFPVARRGRLARVRITGAWGWPAIPIKIEQACLIQAARVFNRKKAPEGIIGLNQFGVVRVAGKPDPDVMDLVNSYKLKTVA